MVQKRRITPQIRKMLDSFKKKDLTKKEAQTVVDEARAQLEKRKAELLKELEKKMTVRSAKYKLKIRISDFASLEARFLEGGLYIMELRVGDYFAENSALRKLGIARLLIEKAKECAKKQGVKRVTLLCKPELAAFFRHFGFFIIKKYKTLVRMVCVIS